MTKPTKKETVAEFLARGGKITKVATPTPTTKPETIRSISSGGPVTIVTMEDADLYHGETKKSIKAPKRKAKGSTIDVSALPEELRKKYVDNLLEEEDEATED